MALETAKEHLRKYHLEDRIRLFDSSSATVELAAKALGCEEARIAKTLSFENNGAVLLIVAAGDARIDNSLFKKTFHFKAHMPSADVVLRAVGHAVGGVCPFGVNDGVDVWLDKSLCRFDVVYPACGSANSAVETTVEELFAASEARGWVDVCKGWQGELTMESREANS